MTNTSIPKNKMKQLPDPLLPVIPFDYKLLPKGPLRGFAKDVSERLQCPPDFIAASMMVAIAAAIGKSIQIEPKEKDDWKVVANLWGMIIGSPSQLKSPAVSEALKPIRKFEIETLKGFKTELAQYLSKEIFYEIKHNAAVIEAKKFIKNGDDVNAQKVLDDDVKNKPVRPKQKRYVANDTTTEKLGELLNENPNGLLQYRDELSGFLKGLDNITKPNDRSFYLEAWDGNGTYTYDRIGRGSIFIENMTVSMLGTIQPSVYSNYIDKASRNGAGDDGFAQRFQLSVYPDPLKVRKRVDRKPDAIALDEYRKIIEKIIDRAQTDKPTVLKFSDKAQVIFNDWLDNLDNIKLQNQDDHSTIISHLAKYRSLMPSIALLLHVAEYCDASNIPPVSEDAALLACEWCSYLESHARRIYSTVTNSPIVTAEFILRKIKGNKLNKNFTLRDIQRKGWAGLKEKKDIEMGLDVLVEHYCLAEYEKPMKLGRPSLGYQINPLLLSQKPANTNKGSQKHTSKPTNNKKRKSKNKTKPKKIQ